jgi:hypothetical protein
MTRVMAFAVVFLTGTACHHDIKTASVAASTLTSDRVIESVTTAPTERVMERWHFSVTPGIGRQLPAGGVTGILPAASAPFLKTVGLGYAVDEYERITEKLEPVAKTKTTESTSASASAATATERETDVGPGFKFYLGLAIALTLILVGAYMYFKHAGAGGLLALIKKVLS